MKFLLAPNSYKEVADSIEAVNLFNKYLNAVDIKNIDKPISDGGDGFLSICRKCYNIKFIKYNIIKSYDDNLMSIKVGYGQKNSGIFIESAEILGLKTIPKNKRNPAIINSRGLGDLLKKLKKQVESGQLNVDKAYIGIGGTGTNDLGLGACSQFGLKLFDDEKELELKPINYYKVKRIEWQKLDLPFKLINIIDVNNKLLGKSGATLTFGKQKGASDEELQLIEKGFENIIKILINMNVIDPGEKLSGAGGGLAAGLSIFFNAESKKAKDFILEDLGIGKLKDEVDYVITGEGSFDSQSLMEKGSGIIINEFKDSAKKIFLVCGMIESEVKEKISKKVYCIELSKYFSSIEESINNFEKGIELACKEIKDVVNP
jgi:glycerate 2-kinase